MSRKTSAKPPDHNYPATNVKTDQIDPFETGICMKEMMPNTPRQSIRNAAASFVDLVQYSELFVDKSLLIKSVLEKESLISLTYPRKWGKSVNLTMLKTFLERKFDADGYAIQPPNTWSFKFFKLGEVVGESGLVEKFSKPPLIAQYGDIITEFLAKYSVIYVDLSTVNPIRNTFDGFFDAFRKTISTVFEEHDYLVESCRKLAYGQNQSNLKKTKAEILLKKFEKYVSQKEDSLEEMACSLKYLSAILRYFFSRRVFILIDDYDALIQRMYFEKPSDMDEEEARKIYNFFINFMSKTFTTNNNIRNGVITGVFDLSMCFPNSGLNHVANYNLMNKNMNPFFGFTKTEVDQLLASLSIPDVSREEALQWYGGYRMLDFPDIILYDPWSIVNFANNKKVGSYWRDTGNLNILPNILLHNDVKEIFEASLCDGTVINVTRRNLKLRYEDLMTLKNLASKDGQANMDDGSYNLIFALLYATGYLTSTVNDAAPSTRLFEKIPLRLANKEAEKEILGELRIIYLKTFGINILNVAEHAASSLIEFIESNGKCLPLKLKLETDLRNLRDEINNSNFVRDKNTDVRLALYLISFFAKFNFNYDANWNVVIDDEKKSFPTRFSILYKNHTGVIFGFAELNSEYCNNVTLDKIGEDVSNKGKSLRHLFRQRGVKSVHFIGFVMLLNDKRIVLYSDVEEIK